MFGTNPQINTVTLARVGGWIRSLVEWIHALPSFHPTVQLCCFVQSLTPPPAPQPPRTFNNTPMSRGPQDPYSARADYPERQSEIASDTHPPWVGQSRAPAPESAVTGVWLLHHRSRLRKASRSGVHDSAVAFPFTTCRHFLKSEHTSLCRTGCSRRPFLDAILWWSSLQKRATLQPPQVSIGASSPRCCLQPLHMERAQSTCACRYCLRRSSASSSSPVSKARNERCSSACSCSMPNPWV